jgi:hypothetical protein
MVVGHGAYVTGPVGATGSIYTAGNLSVGRTPAAIPGTGSITASNDLIIGTNTIYCVTGPTGSTGTTGSSQNIQTLSTGVGATGSITMPGNIFTSNNLLVGATAPNGYATMNATGNITMSNLTYNISTWPTGTGTSSSPVQITNTFNVVNATYPVNSTTNYFYVAEKYFPVGTVITFRKLYYNYNTQVKFEGSTQAINAANLASVQPGSSVIYTIGTGQIKIEFMQLASGIWAITSFT